MVYPKSVCKVLSLLLVFSLLSALSISVFADTEPEAVKINGEVSSVSAAYEYGVHEVTYMSLDKGSITITDIDSVEVEFTGDVSSGSGNAIEASDGEYKIIVDGNVTTSAAESTGICASKADNENVTAGGNVTVKGSVTGTGNDSCGISADGKGTSVTVGTEKTGEDGESVPISVKGTGTAGDGNYGVYATGEAKVTVNGSVEWYDNGVIAKDDGSKVTVYGDVSAAGEGSVGASAADGGSVEITGLVSGESTGVQAGGADSCVIVSGTVKGGKTGADASGKDALVWITGDASGGEKGVCAQNSAGALVVGNAEGTGENSFGAYAEGGGTISVINSVSGGWVGAYALNSNVSVGENAVGGSQGALAYGKSTVTVGGDAEATGSGVDSTGAKAMDGGTVSVDGSAAGKLYGAYAEDSGSSVTVGKAAEGGLAGAYACAGGKVAVGGDAVGTGTDSTGAMALDGGTVSVDGSVKGTDRGISVRSGNSGATVVTAGNAEGSKAIVIAGEGNSVVVEGKASGEYAAAIYEGTSAANTVIVKELDGKFGILKETVQGEDPGETVTEVSEAAEESDLSILKSIICYIVDKQLNGAVLSGTSSVTVEGKAYETASEDNELTVNGSNIETVTAGENNTVTANPDGTFTIKVGRGGGLDITVTIKPAVYNGEPAYYVEPVQNVVLLDIKPAGGSNAAAEVYIREAGKSLEISSEIAHGSGYIACFADAAVVNIDGIVLDSGMYSLGVKNGKLVVVLASEYLDSLSFGNHEAEISIGAYSFKVIIAI